MRTHLIELMFTSYYRFLKAYGAAVSPVAAKRSHREAIDPLSTP